MLCRRASPHRDRKEVSEASLSRLGGPQKQLQICEVVRSTAVEERGKCTRGMMQSHSDICISRES